MKIITILISIILCSGTMFSQNKIVKAYNNKNYDKCLSLCNKHIQNNTDIKQTAYLYKGLIYGKKYEKYPQAIDCLFKLKASKNFTEFYTENKKLFSEIQNSILSVVDSASDIPKDLPWLKKLSKLYLYRFEFTDSEGTGDYKTKSSLTDKNVEFLKYRLLLGYTKKIDFDIPPFKALKEKEILLLFSILVIASPKDDYKPVYNEIYSYLKKEKKFNELLEMYSLKYAKKDDFTYRPQGNPDLIKKTIDYEKIAERVNSINKENEKTVKILSEYLSKDFNEAEKVYAIYHWIEKNIKYVADSTSKASVNIEWEQAKYDNRMVRPSQTAKYVLQNKFGVCEGYASLFNALCLSSGINSEYVSGHAIGTRLILGAHGWNIVEIDKEWYLIDVTWGDKKNFLANPVIFNETHNTEKNKQLLFAPYSKAYFMKNVKEYAENVNKSMNDSLSMLKLAGVYYDKDDYENAINTYLKYSETYTKSFDYYYYLGLSYYYESNNDDSEEKAVEELKKALEIKPNNIVCLTTIASSHKGIGNFEEAYKYIIKAKEISPNNNRIHRSEAYLLLDMKAYKKALIIADSLVINQSKDIRNFVLRAKIHKKNKQYRKAIADLETVHKKENENTAAISSLSGCWLELEEYDKALYYIEKYLLIKPENNFALNRKRYLYFLKKDYEKAYEIAKMKVEKDSLNQNDLSLLSWYSLLSKRYNEAIIHAKKSIAMNEKTEVWNSLALAYTLTNEYDKAEKIYLQYKDKEYTLSKDFKTYGDFFLKWLNYLTENNIYHKDFDKVIEILK